MKVSIITVTYNSESFLESCISSVRNQSYKDIEHIIVDGGSQDGTMKIVKRFKHLTYISEQDSGIYEAINKGIRLATGELIGVLNSDDIFSDNNVVESIVKQFDGSKLSAVFANVQFVLRNDINKKVRFYSSKFFRSWMFKFGFQPAHPTFYARKELFERLGCYRTDLKIAGDFELLLRFLLKGGVKYEYVNEVWVKMRIGGVSTSGFQSVFQLNEEIIKAHQLNGLYTNKALVYSKYLIKWWGFIRK